MGLAAHAKARRTERNSVFFLSLLSRLREKKIREKSDTIDNRRDLTKAKPKRSFIFFLFIYFVFFQQRARAVYNSQPNKKRSAKQFHLIDSELLRIERKRCESQHVFRILSFMNLSIYSFKLPSYRKNFKQFTFCLKNLLLTKLRGKFIPAGGTLRFDPEHGFAASPGRGSLPLDTLAFAFLRFSIISIHRYRPRALGTEVSRHMYHYTVYRRYAILYLTL